MTTTIQWPNTIRRHTWDNAIGGLNGKALQYAARTVWWGYAYRSVEIAGSGTMTGSATCAMSRLAGFEGLGTGTGVATCHLGRIQGFRASCTATGSATCHLSRLAGFGGSVTVAGSATCHVSRRRGFGGAGSFTGSATCRMGHLRGFRGRGTLTCSAHFECSIQSPDTLTRFGPVDTDTYAVCDDTTLTVTPMALILRQGDTAPTGTAKLRKGNAPMDLSAATAVTFNWRTTDGVLRTRTCTIDSAAAGNVSWAWADGDSDVPGQFPCYFHVTFVDGTTATDPNGSTMYFRVTPALLRNVGVVVRGGEWVRKFLPGQRVLRVMPQGFCVPTESTNTQRQQVAAVPHLRGVGLCVTLVCKVKDDVADGKESHINRLTQPAAVSRPV